MSGCQASEPDLFYKVFVSRAGGGHGDTGQSLVSVPRKNVAKWRDLTFLRSKVITWAKKYVGCEFDQLSGQYSLSDFACCVLLGQRVFTFLCTG